jgi:tRNA A37 N6-isopentenylltransferase MiaA
MKTGPLRLVTPGKEQEDQIDFDAEFEPKNLGSLSSKELDALLGRLLSEITSLEGHLRINLARQGQLRLRAGRLNEDEAQESARLVSTIPSDQTRLSHLKELQREGGRHAQQLHQAKQQALESFKAKLDEVRRKERQLRKELEPRGDYASRVDAATRALELALAELQAAEEERAQAEGELRQVVETLTAMEREFEEMAQS